MKKASVRDLRNNFSKLEAWLGEGERIQIEKRGRAIAVLEGLPPEGVAAVPRPDFAGRRKANWGEQVFDAERVATMRAAELEGEEG